MRMSRIAVALAAALAAQVLPVDDAGAQIPGLYSLPQSDFVWNWGSNDPERRRGPADMEVSGAEAQFRCELSAKMRVSSTMTETDLRDIERDLTTRLDFIYATSE